MAATPGEEGHGSPGFLLNQLTMVFSLVFDWNRTHTLTNIFICYACLFWSFHSHVLLGGVFRPPIGITMLQASLKSNLRYLGDKKKIHYYDLLRTFTIMFKSTQPVHLLHAIFQSSCLCLLQDVQGFQVFFRGGLGRNEFILSCSGLEVSMQTL